MKIISAQYVVSMKDDPMVAGAVAIEDGEIIDVGREEDLLKRYPNAYHEDYAHHALLPGLINCHTHLDMSLHRDFENDPVRNVGITINFVDWLINSIDYKRRIDPGTLRSAVEWGIDECIQAGTTCVADVGNYEGIFSILEQKNMRAVLFPEVMSYDSSVAKDLFESALAIIEKYMDYDSDLVHVGAGPHSPYMLSRNLLRIMSQYCYSSKIPIMMHVAESFSEMEFFHNSSGDVATKLFPNIGWGEDLPPEHHRTPLEHLAKIGFLQAQPLLVGCTQATGSDLDYIAQSGSKIVLVPRSHRNLQLGVAAYKEMLDRRILTVLGTDGIPSVNNLSLWEEMRTFIEQQSDKVRLSGNDVLGMVTSKAALALGLDAEIGTLEKGKKADLILIDVRQVASEGDFLMNLIQTVKDYHIHKVIIGGETVKSLM